MKKEAKYILLLLMTLGTALAACKKSEVIGKDISFVAAYNATTNAAGLKFLIDGQAINSSSLAPGQKSTYYGVYEGSWNTEAVPTNSTTTYKRDMTFTAGEHNSIFVIGPKDSLDYFIIKDDPNIRDLNKVKIKFLNLSPDAGTLSLEMQLLGNVAKFPASAYKAFSDYQNFNGGVVYTLTLRNSTTNAVIGTPITAEFTQGKIYTVWARGSLKGILETERLAIQISEVN